jgi:ribosomal protein S14
MSTKLVLNKDFNIRLVLSKNRLKNRVSKLLTSDVFIPVETRVFNSIRMNNRYSTLSCKSRNRCIISGRSRAVFKYVKLTRMMFKNLAVKGNIVGVKKASW